MINGVLAKLLNRWASKTQSRAGCSPAVAQLIVVVEGRHDIEFLRRISKMLHVADGMLPDLGEHERAGELIFLPIGGGDVIDWATRLSGVGIPELHIYDRESSPESEIRVQAAALVNSRPACRAFVSRMRSLENYVHPFCIAAVSGLQVSYGDDGDVADIVARGIYERDQREPAWAALPGRARKRYRERAKRWINRAAAERMTVELLDEHDSFGEIRTWLAAAAASL